VLKCSAVEGSEQGVLLWIFVFRGAGPAVERDNVFVLLVSEIEYLDQTSLW